MIRLPSLIESIKFILVISCSNSSAKIVLRLSITPVFKSISQAVPDADTKNMDLSFPDNSVKSTRKPTIALPPILIAFCSNSFNASSYMISSFLLYVSDLPPKKSVKEAAISEKTLVPITMLLQIVFKYFFIQHPSIEFVVVTIYLISLRFNYCIFEFYFLICIAPLLYSLVTQPKTRSMCNIASLGTGNGACIKFPSG